MLHIIINKEECEDIVTNTITDIFNSFINYIDTKELLVINANPIDISIVGTHYFPKTYSSHVYSDTSRLIINNLNVLYGKGLDIIKKIREKLLELNTDFVNPVLDTSMLESIVDNFLKITVSCKTAEEALTLEKKLDIKDAYKCGILTLFSDEKDKVEDGVYYFYKNDTQSLSTLFDKIITTLKKQ